MKYSLQPDVHHLEPGSKIVLCEFFQYSKDGNHVRLPAVVGTYHAEKRLRDYGYGGIPEDDTRPHVIASDGGRFDIAFDRHGSGTPRFKDLEGYEHEVMWTLPVPNASDDEIIAFVRAFRGEGKEFGKDMESDHDENSVFLVEKIENGRAIARMVCWLNDTLGEYQMGYQNVEGSDMVIHSDYAFNFIPQDIADGFPSLLVKSGPHALSAYEINIRMKELPDGVEVGSIVVGGRITCRYVRDIVLTTVFTPRIAGRIDEAGLEKWLPCPGFDETAMKGRSKVEWDGFSKVRPVVPLTALQDHLKEIERAKEALLPDEAFVLVFPPEEGISRYDPSIVLLGTRGETFFEDVGNFRDDIAHSAPDEGGLWVFGDASYWSSQSWEGEWDGGLDGSWRPATDEDLAVFDYTRDQVIAEATDSYEEGDEWKSALEDGTFTEKMMEIAAVAHAKELERQEAVKLKLAR
jgi:hypothetical protein